MNCQQIDEKLKAIRNNFARNINIGWHKDDKGRFVLSPDIIIEDNDLDYIVNSLLDDKNNNVLWNIIRFIEYIIKTDVEKLPSWLDKIVHKFDDKMVDVVSKEIIHLFKVIHEKAKDLLLDKIKSTSEHRIKYNIIFIIGEIRIYDFKISQYLIKLITDDDNDLIRSVIATSFAKIKDEDAVDILIYLLENDSSEEVRYNLAYALGEIRSEKSIPELIKALDDKNPDVQEKAAEALGKIGEVTDETVEKLIEVLKNNEKSSSVRKEAAWVLAKFGICDIIPLLIDEMKVSSESELREAAITIVDFLHEKCSNADEAMSHLVAIKENDYSQSVRLAATRSLKSMCERKGLNIEECITALVPRNSIKEKFWKEQDISELEVFFDKCKSENIEDRIIASTYYLTFQKKFNFVTLLDIYSILRYIGMRISHSLVEKEFTEVIEKGLLSNFEGGYRLSKKGREKVDELLEKKEVEVKTGTNSHHSEVKIVDNTEIVDKTAFIAYSWDNDEHKKWVENFAAKLQENGILTYLDQWYIKFGIKTQDFMNQIDEVDYIIVICTSNYNKQLKKQGSGAHYEGSIISGKMLEGYPLERIIPVYIEGSKISPPFLKGAWGLNMKDERNFEEEFEKLVKHIFNTNGIKPPPLGKVPEFKSIFDIPIEAKAKLLSEKFEDKNLLLKEKFEYLRKNNLSNQIKGKLMEEFCEEFFISIPGFEVIDKNLSRNISEFDIIIANNSKEPFFLNLQSPLILAEIKMKNKKLTIVDMQSFLGKILDYKTHIKMAIIIAMNGFSKNINRFLLDMQKEGIIIVTISGNDLDEFFKSSSKQISHFLINKITKSILI